jgi:hypothetical protein
MDGINFPCPPRKLSGRTEETDNVPHVDAWTVSGAAETAFLGLQNGSWMIQIPVFNMVFTDGLFGINDAANLRGEWK